MNWLATVAFYGLMVVGSGKMPDYPAIGSGLYAKVANHSADTAAVFAIDARIDSTVRFLTVLAPGDSGFTRLPYEDTSVLLVYITNHGGWWAPAELWSGKP